MATTRTQFAALPEAVLHAIEQHAGPLITIDEVPDGFNSELAVRLHTPAGRIFVKGLRTDHPRVWTQQREAAVNPHVLPVTARLLWHIQAGEWDLLGFEHLPGRHANYAPDSPDLPKLVDALTWLARTPCPDIPLKRAEQRFAGYVDKASHAEFFAGEHLLHTDLNNLNVIVSDQARFVDWAWATRGAAWLDAAYWLIWLIAAGGHGPAEAESWAARVPTWSSAPRAGVDAFAAANANLWEDIADHAPDSWTRRMVTATRAWRRFRSARCRAAG